MKFCQTCGAEVNDNAVICVKCGCSLNPMNEKEEKRVDESISAGLVILSVLLPIFGIIYWPVKAKSRPKCAMACGIAGIVSWVVYLMFMMGSGF